MAELVAGLSIATLLLAFGLPAWTSWLAEQRVRNAGQRLLAGLVAARASALGGGTTVRLCATAGAGTCVSQRDWSRGWMAQQGGSGGWRTLLESGPLAAGTRIEVNTPALESGVAFEPRGFAVQSSGGFASGSWLVCAPGARSRSVTLAPSGRARISSGFICT